MSQLSSLAGVPLHLGMRELCEMVAKPSALLSTSLDEDLGAKDVEKLRTSLKTTKFVEIAEGIKAAVTVKDRYKISLAELAKAGAVLPNSDGQELEHLATKISKAGTCISTCFLVNLIVNKLTPMPAAKSRAAFVREYELTLRELKFSPNDIATRWLADLLKSSNEQDKKGSKPAPTKEKPAPKKSVGTAELY